MNPHDLDNELQAALATEPSPEQIARLSAFWRRRSNVERRRRLVVRSVALAATVLVAVSATWWMKRPHRDEPQFVKQESPPAAPTNVAPSSVAPSHPAQPQLVENPSPRAVSPSPPAIAGKARSVGRPATGYEQAMFAMQTHTSIDAGRADLVAELDQLIAQLVDDSTVDAAALAQTANLAQRDAEPLLIKRLPRAADDERRAIVALLTAIGTPRCLPALVQVAARDPVREPSLAAVERIAGPAGLADAVRLAPNRRVRAALLNRMLTADAPSALAGYLALVSDDASRSEALAAAVAARPLPVEALLAKLADGEKKQRLAAALVLGHVDGPQIARSLIALVSQGEQAPAEAWVALLACRDPVADRFLAQAAYQPRWLAQVNNARVFWARFTP